ncbi:GNAT family N-acetyltransferase [Roseivirga sp.]|uniref:GNAT family N-acetyltransferase n=1 Tax=Roseivirga sp. TaxID=1964215 RepID=UPI003B8B9D3A
MVKISQAQVSDYAEIHQMILDFATFQKTPEKVSISLDDMKINADDFKALIIRDQEKAIGFATYYFGFSSWSGRHLFLDDLYLETPYRKQGLGQEIMDQLESIAKNHQCKSMRWLVSKWNDSAIGFYKKRGAVIEDTELTCMLKLK